MILTTLSLGAMLIPIIQKAVPCDPMYIYILLHAQQARLLPHRRLEIASQVIALFWLLFLVGNRLLFYVRYCLSSVPTEETPLYFITGPAYFAGGLANLHFLSGLSDDFLSHSPPYLDINTLNRVFVQSGVLLSAGSSLSICYQFD